VRVREAEQELADANWFERIPARRRFAKAQDELSRAEEALGPRTANGDVGGLP
jgi:membrane protein